MPADGFAAFLVAMRTRGFTEQEVATMSRSNPARLLGLTAD
jgi:predicted metal-dependent phosphotriesterase family hydrolase